MRPSKVDEAALYQHPAYRIGRVAILVALVTATFWQYVYGFYGNEQVAQALERVVQGIGNKPYIYRCLVPFGVRLLMWLKPLRIDVYVVLVMYLAALGMLFSFQYLYHTFWKGSVFADLAILLGISLMFLLIYKEKKIYDLAAMFLFTASLGLMARGKFVTLAVLYPFACLAKETAIFLIPIFFLYFWARLPRFRWTVILAYQLLCYGLVRLFLMWYFRANPGEMFNFYWRWHIEGYAAQPGLVLLYLVGGGVVMYWVWKNWAKKPRFLRLTASIMFPSLIVLYFVSGMPFEIRVFAEAYPVVYLLAVYGLVTKVGYTPDPFVASNLAL
ncbi:MAG: hypothetical protein ACOYYS_07395 [Chloroflexota bacterium]